MSRNRRTFQYVKKVADLHILRYFTESSEGGSASGGKVCYFVRSQIVATSIGCRASAFKQRSTGDIATASLRRGEPQGSSTKERWLSGRKHRFRKPAYRKVSGVRISPSPQSKANTLTDSPIRPKTFWSAFSESMMSDTSNVQLHVLIYNNERGSFI